MSEAKFTVSPPPHVKSAESVRKIMWLVSLSLLPAAAGGVVFFGTGTIPVFISAIAGAMAAEGAVQFIRKAPVTLSDGSAFLTGFLVALNMPPDLPLWLPFLGSVFAIAVVKQCFGGLGHNIFNPALGGRVFLILAYTRQMTTEWKEPAGAELSAVTGATPLSAWVEGNSADTAALFSPEALFNLFTGRVGGCIGETSALLLLAGAVFLFIKKYVSWHIPVFFLGTLGFFAAVFGRGETAAFFPANIFFHLFAGGAFLGAFFMATDMATSPMTARGKMIFGAGCGFLTASIRFYAGYPEGVSFAILLMNSAVPVIDRHTRPRIYGTRKKRHA